MSIQSYFDLSQPVTFRKPHATSPHHGAARPATGLSAPSEVSLAWQIGMYFTVIASIVASRFLDLYRAGVAGDFGLDWKYLLFVVIASLLVFPTVYDKARSERSQPVFIQLVVVFTTGMGWEKILSTAVGK